MRFLFATDGSRGAETALQFLMALPLSAADHITVLTVPSYSFMGSHRLAPTHAKLVVESGDEAAYAVAERARSRLVGYGVGVSAVVRPGPIATAAQQLALAEACDVIVVGSRGLGAFAGSLLGSVARGLARHAPASVLVVRERGWAPRRVLLAVDGSEEARQATALMTRFPLPAGCVTLRHEVTSVAATGPARGILAQAMGTGVDLIVLGVAARGAGPWAPSLTDQVLSHAHCAVLVGRSSLVQRRASDDVRAPSRAVLAT